MTNGTRWFERRFEFDLTPADFSAQVERLANAPAKLSRAVEGVPHEVLVAAVPGRWTAQEHAGHLADLEELWIARVADYLGGRDHLTPADLTNRRTHEANHNAVEIETILDQFRQRRESLLRQVSRLEPEMVSRALPHPRMQVPMRLLDHLYFVAEHDKHHLVTIGELIADVHA